MRRAGACNAPGLRPCGHGPADPDFAAVPPPALWCGSAAAGEPDSESVPHRTAGPASPGEWLGGASGPELEIPAAAARARRRRCHRNGSPPWRRPSRSEPSEPARAAVRAGTGTGGVTDSLQPRGAAMPPSPLKTARGSQSPRQWWQPPGPGPAPTVRRRSAWLTDLARFSLSLSLSLSLFLSLSLSLSLFPSLSLSLSLSLPPSLPLSISLVGGLPSAAHGRT